MSTAIVYFDFLKIFTKKLVFIITSIIHEKNDFLNILKIWR